MPTNVVVSPHTASERSTIVKSDVVADSADSLFERVAWLYAFCREWLFRDDTERMISVLWRNETPGSGIQLVELGCGPGFYSRNLAKRFPQITVTGVDRSQSQIRAARQRALAQNVK